MNSNDKIAQTANDLRLEVVRMVNHAGDGHPGPCMSAMDIIASLYFGELNVDPQNPEWEDRDRFVLSKGHACPALYAALAYRGFFSREDLDGLRFLGTNLQGHPTLQKTRGLDMTSGSLGNGLGIAVGMALAARYRRKDYYTYVLMGDGELEEGAVWESAMCAHKYRLDHLIGFVDQNGWQSGGTVEACSGIVPGKEKWEAFGWFAQEIDGHDVSAIREAIRKAKEQQGAPAVIVANTIKGKGIDYMENDNSWHKRVPTDEEYERAKIQMEGNGR